jgi:hypothetical protein
MKIARAIVALNRRQAFLQHRVASARGLNLSFDEQEIAAIEEAVKALDYKRNHLPRRPLDPSLKPNTLRAPVQPMNDLYRYVMSARHADTCEDNICRCGLDAAKKALSCAGFATVIARRGENDLQVLTVGASIQHHMNAVVRAIEDDEYNGIEHFERSPETYAVYRMPDQLAHGAHLMFQTQRTERIRHHKAHALRAHLGAKCSLLSDYGKWMTPEGKGSLQQEIDEMRRQLAALEAK